MASGIGLICGALAVAMTSDPSPARSGHAAKSAIETTGAAVAKVDPNPVVAEFAAEIESGNGSLPTSECERQTWPYISQQCLAEQEAGRRKVRIITTDKIAPPVVAAIEAEPRSQGPRTKEAPKVVGTLPVKPAAVAVTHSNAVAKPAAPPTPVPEEVATETPKVATLPASLPAAAPEPQSEKQQKAASQSKRSKNAREARGKRGHEGRSRRAPVQEFDDADDSYREAIRTSSGARSAGSSGRVVERWTEREYEVPSESGAQRRRVIVRSPDWGGSSSLSGGPFGFLFGRQAFP